MKRLFLIFIFLVLFGGGCFGPKMYSETELSKLDDVQIRDEMKKMMAKYPDQMISEQTQKKEVERMRDIVFKGRIERLATIEPRSRDSAGQARLAFFEGRWYVLISQDFFVIPGPQLEVILSKDSDAQTMANFFSSDTLKLGKLKAWIGGQWFEIPKGINPLDFQSIAVYSPNFRMIFSAGRFQISS